MNMCSLLYKCSLFENLENNHEPFTLNMHSNLLPLLDISTPKILVNYTFSPIPINLGVLIRKSEYGMSKNTCAILRYRINNLLPQERTLLLCIRITEQFLILNT